MNEVIYKNNRIEIINFTTELKENIKILNHEWLEKYFHIEKSDIKSLSNPQEEIIDKGGYIFYAKMKNEIVGTVSLIKKDNTNFELGKMAVSEIAQGNGVGTIMLEYCISFAKRKLIKKLTLYSNTKLQSAIHLYTKYGFKEIDLEQGLYERANIKMELII